MNSDAPWHRGLLVRTALSLMLGFLVLQTLFIGISAYYVGFPLVQRSADDLAALMLNTVLQWQDLPNGQREIYTAFIWEAHALRIEPAKTTPLSAHRPLRPYIRALHRALQAHSGREVAIWVDEGVDEGRPAFYWFDIQTDRARVRIGFERARIGTRPVMAIVPVVAIGMTLSLLLSFILAGRLSRPLRRMAGAAVRVGLKDGPGRIPETGPNELQDLARAFNHMSARVEELLANRTTLLAGISHDLRTPLTRMQLALDMLERRHDPELIVNLQDDLHAMEELIAQFLGLARGIQARETPTPCELGAVLGEWVDEAARAGGRLRYTPPPEPIRMHLALGALKRITQNLIDNARRYAGDAPIDVSLKRETGSIMLRVEDRGPGIPEDELNKVLQPFYRLERSRSSEGGGSGLGLSIAVQLSESNGWSLKLQARVGGGLSAIIRVPFTRDE